MDSRFQGKYAKVVVSDGGKDVDGDSLVHVRFLWPSSHDDVALNHADARTLAHLLLRAVGDEEDPAAKDRQSKGCEETGKEGRTQPEPRAGVMRIVWGERRPPLAAEIPFTTTQDRSAYRPLMDAFAYERTVSGVVLNKLGSTFPFDPDALYRVTDAHVSIPGDVRFLLMKQADTTHGLTASERARIQALIDVPPEALEAARRLVEDPGQSPASSMYIDGQFIGKVNSFQAHEIDDVLSDDAFMDECAMRAMQGQLAMRRPDDSWTFCEEIERRANALAEVMVARRKRRRESRGSSGD